MSDIQAPGDTVHLPAGDFGLNRKIRSQSKCAARSKFNMKLKKPKIEGFFKDLYLILCFWLCVSVCVFL